jgi:AraC-like DNA-binding protein
MLTQARVDLAVRMLQSPLFDRVTTAEIGRRAGFTDASHFVTVLRKRTGASVCFDVGYCAPPESISKRAPSTTRTSLRDFSISSVQASG